MSRKGLRLDGVVLLYWFWAILMKVWKLGFAVNRSGFRMILHSR